VLMSQLHRWQKEFWPQLDPECQKMITPKQHLFIWLEKKDATPNYARTNNLHVMWNGGIINICDGHNFVNVVFQPKHLNRIIIGLEMFGPFRELH
jgi:hypothetical protein